MNCRRAVPVIIVLCAVLAVLLPEVLTINSTIDSTGQTCSVGCGPIFAHEPCNLTISEYKMVIFNCSLVHRSNQDQATWIIRGLQYFFHDFLYTPEYSYNPINGSLTIHNASRSLDGASFQCIINRKSSRIGYLTIEYQAMTSTPDSILNIYLPTTDHEGNLTNDHESFDSTVTTARIEINGGNVVNKLKVPRPILVIIITAVSIIVVSVISVSLILGCCYNYYRLKNRSLASRDHRNTGTPESFMMVKNKVYYDVNIHMKRNKSYEDTGQNSSPDHSKSR